MSSGVLRPLFRPARERAAERAARFEAPRGERSVRRARLAAWMVRGGVALALAAALAVVVWRQTEGVERQRALTRLSEEISVAEAERVEWSNRIQALQSRARITRVARERLGLRVARDDEVVLVPVPAAALEVRP